VYRFVEKYNLPWPQIYFDADGRRGSDNPLRVEYAVRGVPGMFLVDREGKVVDMHMRGPRLEIAVAKLLGKEPVVPAQVAASPSAGSPPKLSNLSLGQEPEIAGPTLDGATVNLRDFQGKPVLVMFWASWCGYCQREMPNVQEVYGRHHADGFEVIGINSDKTREALEAYVRDEQIPWPQIFFDIDGLRGAHNPLKLKYEVRGVPNMFLVDREGKVADLNVRGPRLEPAVARLLGKEPEAENEDPVRVEPDEDNPAAEGVDEDPNKPSDELSSSVQ